MDKITYTATEAMALMQEKRSKYNNRKTPYKDRMYDSVKEAQYAAILDISMRAVKDSERVIEWTPQVPYPVYVKGKKICTYVADFKVMYADGRIEVIDVKSSVTAKLPVYRLKKKLVEAEYGIEIIEEI